MKTITGKRTLLLQVVPLMSKQIKISSWNVNGIRAAIRKGFWDWFNSYFFDIVNIQENKAQYEDVKTIVERDDYDLYWSQAEKKGYSGVSSWVSKKSNVSLMQIGIKDNKFDCEGRTIILEHDEFFLFNGYFPNGREDHSRVEYKLEYSYKILKIAEKLRRETGKGIIICGDINTAHKEIDLARPAQNKNSTGFLINEREYIDELIKKGYYDAFRLKDSSEEIYSWWSYRAGARSRNVGWRIDYFFISEELKDKVKDCYYMKNQMGSDHCPLVLELSF